MTGVPAHTETHTYIKFLIFKGRRWKNDMAEKFLELKFRTSVFSFVLAFSVCGPGLKYHLVDH